jgi:hypothetical protein
MRGIKRRNPPAKSFIRGKARLLNEAILANRPAFAPRASARHLAVVLLRKTQADGLPSGAIGAAG